MFHLTIPFDGTEKDNISQMLFRIMFRLGFEVIQNLPHTDKGFNKLVTNGCSLTKSYKERALAMVSTCGSSRRSSDGELCSMIGCRGSK